MARRKRLEFEPAPLYMRSWRPMWVPSIESTSAPQFYFIIYSPGEALGDDMRFLGLDPRFDIPERASDYLCYLIVADRERGERRVFTRAELGDILRPNWRDFMYFWYPVLERARLMACGMQISEGYTYGIDITSEKPPVKSHAR